MTNSNNDLRCESCYWINPFSSNNASLYHIYINVVYFHELTSTFNYLPLDLGRCDQLS